MHPLVMYEIAKLRIDELHREAANERLAHPWDDDAPSTHQLESTTSRSRIASFVARLQPVRGRVSRPAGAAGAGRTS